MDNTQELTEHLNEETRCQKQMPEPEGIDQTKMSLIKSKHGVSWESIYEILFPGARIPSPYWQPETDSEQAEDPSSPQSRQLQEFEAYSRRVLPQLVEAHLSASLDNDLAPLEETLKARVGDLVRSCQSMVYEKFQKFQQTSKETQEAQSRPSASDSQPNFKPNDTLTRNITPPEQSNKLFFDEPTHLQPAIDFSDVVNKDDGMKYNATQSRTADSGYGSASQSCLCSCHSSIENAMPAEREVMAGAEASGQLKPQCTTCAFYHTESTLDQNLQSGYDWNAIDFDLYHTEQNDENNATFWS
ncbi:uncharacterized protein KY384_001717 [Bacidia gigantensis]|uniref:uncharacterized protein n=1 Tax=Bacidia gigantensis TaxID=2732470 RepID=UPI001D04AA24|nr:uncharacterized protein KY384_001717 [Bacidia gigantensis]KAG8533974.1 hypothetical protein KY384_001717 [Bacidia gigantensis]